MYYLKEIFLWKYTNLTINLQVILGKATKKANELDLEYVVGTFILADLARYTGQWLMVGQILEEKDTIVKIQWYVGQI